MSRPDGCDPARRRASDADGGFALLLVLWTLVPMALLFVMLAAAARSDARLTANLRDAAELEAVADGAIYTTLFELLQRGGAPRDSAPATARLPGADVVVEIANQSGLVNPNIVSPDLLAALLVRLGAEPGRASRIAGAIADWRSPGRQAGRNGAKAAQYRAAGLDYGPPGAPFESLGELGDVLGMPPALLSALAPHLTLYSDGDPDPALADPVVQAALHDLGIVARAGQANSSVVSIAARAQRADGAHALRRAVIRVGSPADRRGWRVLLWETPHGG